jgi:glutamate dehydrogenase
MSRSAKRLSSKQKTQSLSASPPQKKPFSSPPTDFIEAFYAHILPADLALFSIEERDRIASSIWNLGLSRFPGEAVMRIFNPSRAIDGWTVDHTVIEIVNDDMPFLVDSVTGVLQKRGLSVHIVLHPVIPILRDGMGKAYGVMSADAEGGRDESFMHIQIDHCTSEEAKLLEDEVRATLDDVRAAVADWGAMLDRVQEAIGDINGASGKAVSGGDVEELNAFLRWMIDDNFTFLGYRELNLEEKDDTISSIRVIPGRGLGILRDDEARMFGGLRNTKMRLTPALRKYHHQNEVLSIMKTHAVTRVHRVLPMDAIFVRRFNDQGFVVFERLFVGLFTSKTYAQTSRQIPLVRRKIANVITRLNFPPKSHNGRNLMHIISTYPHDELFQIGEDELYTNVLGILQLQERARVALFLRRDTFDRYATYLIYVPRDRYDSFLRERIQKFLEDAFCGTALSWQVRIDDSLLARLFGSIRLTPESPHPDLAKLEADLREMCRTWTSRLRDRLVDAFGEAEALVLLSRYDAVFPKAYQEATDPSSALDDVRSLEKMRAKPSLIVDVNEKGGDRVGLKLLQPERPLLLSESLPLIENMGLKIDYMGGPYEIGIKGEAPIYVHEFVGIPAQESIVDFRKAKPVFEEMLAKVWSGEVENDAFNALTLRAGLSWRSVVLLRSFARYLRQLRIPYSHEMIAAALLAHPKAAEQICSLFVLRHDPALKGDRNAKMKALEDELAESLAKIKVLEEDRIIRRYLNLVKSSLRTNYFQTDEIGAPKAHLAIKFDSRTLDFIPLPKPICEIFVYSPRVEAVHLRGGKVARGGIRWSDRRDDFRAEILGLMKAQMVKNIVIVPVGSKGGFIVKRPPAEADKMQAEGVACYKIMMHGLLDLTDNYKGGKIAPPPNLVRHDGDDPYLVVAADKGTATFSDIANGISREYGYWLDDAFASGGSAGYDHKGMGITARGAWEAIKRHFRELGKDIQTEPFTCIGVGDMSGDVFGNGMLLSPSMLLLGAFDHRHIFCDPTPNPAKSLVERKRMFALPRSSWNDYNRALISKGGGIFARSEKTIKITPEMKKAFGILADTLSPSDLMRAMLKADIDLLYFGGIGTYVKASTETQADAGDRANESLRIDGKDLRAKVVGEGANLALTQRGRIEYARKGGRLNTDAIDNSAGVDTSDHEVNIKILLRRAIDRKTLTFAARDKLLASMTDKIGDLVLRDNYLQTQALSVAEVQAPDIFAAHVRCMQVMEHEGLLNRAVEFLPDDAEIDERKRLGKGLSRPEIAVVFAYAKLWLYQKILDSKLPDDPALQRDINSYFPEALQTGYAKDIAQHHLRSEIAATVVTNDIVNHAGAGVLLLVAERGDVESVVRAYILARDAFALPELWAGIEALDNKIPASMQTRMLISIRSALALAMERLQSDREALAHLDASIKTYRKGLEHLVGWLSGAKDLGLKAFEKDDRLDGVPETLAKRVNLLSVLVGASDLIDLGGKGKVPLADLAAIFFGLGKRLDIDRLTRLAIQKTRTPREHEAAISICKKLGAHHRRLTAQMAAKKARGQRQTVEAWVLQNAEALKNYDALISESRITGVVDLPMLLLADERLCELSA